MRDDDTVEWKDLGLKKLIEALSETEMGRIGILGGHNARIDQEHVVNKKGVGKYKEKLSSHGPYKFVTKTEQTNAEIGLKHEFGQDGMPIRSFLRMPISTKMQSYLEKKGNFGNALIKSIIEDGTLIPILKKVLLVGEEIIDDAFETGGFGQWKPSNMNNKNTQQTLVETGQLRKSITSDLGK